MANSDYEKTGFGAFASVVRVAVAMDHLAAEISYDQHTLVQPIVPGMIVMVGDEIMSVVGVGILKIMVKRGCADTIPAPHDAGSVAWVFDNSMVGNDSKEWAGGETIGVKVSPYTSAGAVPLQQIAPKEVTFDFRFMRPYPPAKVMVNGARWFAKPAINDATPALFFSWAHRDRVLQADQLIGHDDDSIGPETGVTYTLRIYNPITDLLVREEVGIIGNTFTYRRSQATFDMGQPSEVLEPTFSLAAYRDGVESMQHYEGEFTLVPKYPLESNYLAFESRVIEAPFVINAQRGVIADGNYGLAMAARPSDRASDDFTMIANGTAVQGSKYTPWLTTEFRLPELETTINVRSSSLYDGVPLDASLVGKLALIGDEIVQVAAVLNDKQISVTRGCCDTIPAVHIAGTRVWFFGAANTFDGIDRAFASTVDYRVRPGVYGPPINLADLPSYVVTFSDRAMRPYAPGQVVVDGRPWFEEAQATSGNAVRITWARRNRHTQGGQIVGHGDDDIAPEAGAAVVLRFFYETPSADANTPPIRHVLRESVVTGGGVNPMAGREFLYTYPMAQSDGLAAGQALGICGTVVIYCQITSTLNGYESHQSYVAPIRVPSYPCT